MYVCGPTVYNFVHIGNHRPVVVFDVLFRLLRRTFGEDAVLYAANITDVDDKINRRAAEDGVAIDVITERYLAAYNADMVELGALRPTFQPRATRTMDAIIAPPRGTSCSTPRPARTTASCRDTPWTR